MNYKIELDEVRCFATEAHRNQKYGVFPYEVHLINVIGTLLKFNIFPINEDNYKILAGGWLHDILEDTNISKDEFINKFGKDIYNIVWSVTDGDGGDRKARKNIMYSRLVLNQNAIIVKLADRIANLEMSLILNNKDKIAMYIDEMNDLSTILDGKITTDYGKCLFDYLKLLANKY